MSSERMTIDEALDMIDHLKQELRAVTHHKLPDAETATVEELCRPISADVTVRSSQHFGAQRSEAGAIGAMTARINKRRGKHG